IRFHDPEFHRREMTLLSSRNALKEDFARILPLLEGGQIDAQAWITHRAGYGDVIERFSTWLDPQERALKVVLEM
ncbi:MAG: alcohol dehydrogenase, partial [Gemmatimonadetes bacterium]|nr:alcohol dehydrogenase [Gemmatimonadota bacterium]